MTRINSGIKPFRLSDEMLLAEHREIKRLPSLFQSRIVKGLGFADIPKTFSLGTGHVKFFLNKPTFTLNRYIEIYDECVRRGFNVTDYRDNWSVYGDRFRSIQYKPTETDIKIVKERIETNYNKSSKTCFRYESKNITKAEATQKLYAA